MTSIYINRMPKRNNEKNHHKEEPTDYKTRPSFDATFCDISTGEARSHSLGLARHRRYHGPSNKSPIRSIGTPFVSGIQTPRITSPEKQISAQKRYAPQTSSETNIFGVTRTTANWKSQCSAILIA